MRMIVHADAVEARVLAPGHEVRHEGDRRPHGDAQVDLDADSPAAHQAWNFKPSSALLTFLLSP